MDSQKLQILTNVLGVFYKTNEEYLFYCPFCEHHKKKMSINIAKNIYKCWVCDESGRNITQLIQRFGTNEQKYEWNRLTNTVDISNFDTIFKEQKEEGSQQKITLPKEFETLTSNKFSLLTSTAIKYLKKRGLTKSDIVKWRIGYCSEGEYKDYIIIPSFNKSGHCNYFIARSYTNNWLKYKNPPVSKDIIFNELDIDWNKDIVLVEGIFDAIKATNAIPLLGSTLNENSKIFKTIVQHKPLIFLALDADVELKTMKIISLFLKYNISLYKINTKDFKDVGEMTKKEFLVRKKDAIAIDLNMFLIQEISQI